MSLNRAIRANRIIRVLGVMVLDVHWVNPDNPDITANNPESP